MFSKLYLKLRIALTKPYGACLLYVRDDGLLLGVARRGTTDQWGLPGGKVEPKESTWLTAIRETQEEAFVFPTNLSELYRGFDEDNHLIVTYLAKQVFREPRQGDAGPVAYITWDQLLTGPFKNYNQFVYKEWLKTKGSPLSFSSTIK